MKEWLEVNIHKLYFKLTAAQLLSDITYIGAGSNMNVISLPQ